MVAAVAAVAAVVAAVAAVAAVVAAVAAVAVASSLGTAADLGEEDFGQMVHKEHMLRRLSNAWCSSSSFPPEVQKSLGKCSAFSSGNDNVHLCLCYKLKKTLNNHS